jgi:hypothetical protein
VSKKTSATRTPSIELAGDAAQLVAAVERLHAGGFDVAELTVGKATIRLNRARGGERDRDDQPAQPTGIYAQHGGEFLARVAAEVIPGVDLQPAIGRVG